MDRKTHLAHQLSPPDDFIGDENGDYGDDDYNRQCTPDEWAVLDRSFPDAFGDNRAPSLEADEAERDTRFAELAAQSPLTNPVPARSPCAQPEALQSSVEGSVITQRDVPLPDSS